MPPEDPKSQADEQETGAPRAWWRSPRESFRQALAWSKANRRKALLLGGTGLAVLIGLVAAGVALWPSAAVVKPITLETALQALDRGEYAAARNLADQLTKQEKPSAEDRVGLLFVRGAAAAYDADASYREESISGYLVAVGYLKEARDQGFPAGREPEGVYLLGKSLYRSGQIIASRPTLREALKTNPQKQGEIHYLLAGAYLGDAHPRLSEALEENGLCLADHTLKPEQQFQALVQRAQIELALGRAADCQTTLKKMPASRRDAPEVALLEGQILMHQARAMPKDSAPRAQPPLAVQQKYQEAIQALRTAQGSDTLTTRITRKAMYLIGVCFLEAGDRRAALNQFARTQKLFAGTPEALVAALEEAELLRQSRSDAEALAGYRQVLQALTDAATYSNPWISLDQLRSRMLGVYQQYLAARDFPVCLELTKQLWPLFPRDRAIELAAETRQAWARDLFAQADRAPAAEADPLRCQGRQQMRQAGRSYAELAQLLIINRRYPDELWNAIQADLEGHDYQNAATLLQEYLKNESRRRHADALASLGEALLAQGRLDEALKAFTDCIELHPQDAAAFRARLFASRTCVEKADLPRAEALLQENLNADVLTPASSEWRESLFDLGRLLVLEGRGEEAVIRLEEAVQRYPDSPRALESQYLIADCYRQNARLIREGLKDVVVESTRILRARQAEKCLVAALERLKKLKVALASRHESGEPTGAEKALLRNCEFAIGHNLFDLGRFDEAIKAYQAAINCCQNRPEALAAYAQVACAYRRLNKPAEARSSLEEAKLMLNRLHADAPFQETTNHTRQQWAELLEKELGVRS